MKVIRSRRIKLSDPHRAEIITIGNELLLGEIVDTNTATIARALRSIGIDVLNTSSVGDSAERISHTLRQAMTRAEVVITAGGLGPTVDDATRDGIAHAFDLPMQFHEDLWQQIQELFARYGRKPTENNRRQAFLPLGALPVKNPVGTAPAFIVETDATCVIALPGVPGELIVILEASVLPYLRDQLDLRHVIMTRIVRTAGVGESWVDDRIQDLEETNNPIIGLAAHAGRVDIRATAIAENEHEAETTLAELEAILRERLGNAVYGTDEDSLEAVALGILSQLNMQLVVVESGTSGALGQALAPHDGPFLAGITLPHGSTEEIVESELSEAMRHRNATAGLGLILAPHGNQQQLVCHFETREGSERLERSYGGPPASAPHWAVSLALNLIRKRLG
jgi:competence/damage-inducible protein CinA-like protein